MRLHTLSFFGTVDLVIGVRDISFDSFNVWGIRALVHHRVVVTISSPLPDHDARCAEPRADVYSFFEEEKAKNVRLLEPIQQWRHSFVLLDSIREKRNQKSCGLHVECGESSSLFVCVQSYLNSRAFQSFFFQTTIDVEFKPVSSISSYELQWKSIEKEWSNLSSASVSVSGDSVKSKAQAHNLEPGTTYCLRLVCIKNGSKGEPGPELIIDTEQVGCTPKQKSGCACTIQ